jgi:two-component system, cell cycle response regulator DivK
MSTSQILIIEDNFDNMILIKMILEREKFAVFSSKNGEEGLEQARRSSPDLIVLDLDLPVIDGWEVLKEIKADPNTQNIPVIIVTAHLLPGENDRVLAAGGSGYVSKPFRVTELLNAIRKIM